MVYYFLLISLLIGMLVGYIIYDIYPTKQEVDNAMVAGIIKERKEKWQKKCRIFTQIKRKKQQIKDLKNQIKALEIDYYNLEGVSYEKEND